MKLFRHIITIVCIVASFSASAAEPLTAKAKGPADQPTAEELNPLQGTWEEVRVGEEKNGKVTITITGNTLHFHRDTNFWFETTITLPAGTNPKQLHAAIKECPTAELVGKVVVAIFKIEDGTLTLATGNGDGEAPKSFEASGDNGLNRYKLRKVQPQKQNAESPKTK